MEKVKKILISLAVIWLVSYALMFLPIGVVFHPMSPASSKQQNKAAGGAAQVVAGASTTAYEPGSIPATGQSEPAGLFLRPVFPATMVMILAGFAMACGYQLVQLGYRGNPPLPK